MRAAALALAAVAVGTACSKGSLQSNIADAGGAGPFAVDATAGGEVGTGPIDARPQPPPLQPPDCRVSTISGGWLPLDFLVLLDRSPSGEPSAWTKVLDALTDQILWAGRTDWGLYGFPKFGPTCGAATVPPAVDLPVVPDNQQAVAAAVEYLITGGEGMPTAAALDVGAAHLRTLAAEEPKFLLLVTNRPPTCDGTGAQLSPAEPAQALAGATAAIARAASEKISTIVLAPSSTASSDAAALDALAEAGGFPRAVGAHKFYDETNFAELFIPPWALSCALPLKEMQEVASVTFNDVVVPRDTEHANGWDYVATQTSYSVIELYGTWCDQLLSSRRYEVKINYICWL